jgi:phosphocarrier protein HPr
MSEIETSKKDTQLTVNELVKVRNEMGVHARPASMIVKIANNYNDTELWVEKDGERVNGKSIMGLMMLGAGKGCELTLIAKGKKAQLLINELKKLFDDKFKEA